MLRVIKIARFMIIQSAIQFSRKNEKKKKEEEEEEEKEKKKPDILGIMKKMIDGFMIRGNKTSMQ